MRVRVACANRLGNRAVNQDRCLVNQRANTALLVVADGMGGHARGELAAQTVIDSLNARFDATRGRLADPADFLQTGLEHAHLDVVAAGRHENPPVQPRTVCVACIVQETHAWWAHVGDSRLYVIRDAKLVTRTRDHSPLDQLLATGAVSEAALRKHPLRNTVNRCLGGGPMPPAPSTGATELEPEDLILLCSDGLWASLPEQRILETYQGGYIDAAVEHLAEDAEKASYPNCDNISLIALRWLGQSPNLARTGDPLLESLDSVSAELRNFANHDPVKRAIDDIHRALLEYASELKK